MRKHLFTIMIAFCVIFCVVLALDLFPILRGGFGWQWSYSVPTWLRVLPLLVSIGVYLWGLTRFNGFTSLNSSRLYQLWCFVWAIVLPLATLFIIDDPYYFLAARTFSGETSGYHMAGAEINNLLEAARTWPQIMGTYYIRAGQPAELIHPFISIHVAANPPGLPIIFYGLNQLLEAMPGVANFLGMPLRSLFCHHYGLMQFSNAEFASAWVNILMPVWTAFTVFPLYRLGGKYAAGWWPLIPAIALFTPVWPLIYPLIAIIAYMSLGKGITYIQSNQNKGLLYVIFAGLLVSLSIFTAFASWPLVGLFGLYIVFSFVKWWKVEEQSLNTVIYKTLLVGLLYTLSTTTLWLVYYLVSGVSLYEILHTGATLHFELERPYLPYLFINLYDFALFAGIPLVLVALSYIKRPRSWTDIDPLALALFFSLLFMINVGRGETGRQWGFLIPFVLIWAARQVTQWSSKCTFLVTMAQALTFFTIACFLPITSIEKEIKNPVPVPQLSQVSTNPLPAPVRFGDYFTLLGSKVILTEKQLHLTLLWRVEKPVPIPYHFSALVVDSNTQPVSASHVFQPFDGGYPTTCWQPGTIISHTDSIPLETPLSPSDYWISLAMFDLRNFERLTVSQPDAPVDQQIGLGPVQVR